MQNVHIEKGVRKEGRGVGVGVRKGNEGKGKGEREEEGHDLISLHILPLCFIFFFLSCKVGYFVCHRNRVCYCAYLWTGAY